MEDTDFALLYEAFRCLRRCGNRRAVHVSTVGMVSRPPRFCSTLIDLAMRPRSNAYHFAGLVVTLVDSGIRLTELDLCPGEID